MSPYLFFEPKDENQNDSAGSFSLEIERIQSVEIPRLLDLLPLVGHRTSEFKEVNGKWIFYFRFLSHSSHFSACGVGVTPDEAYTNARQMLDHQVMQWHRSRKIRPAVVPPAQSPELEKHSTAVATQTKKTEVLIIDDDIDTANLLDMTFRKLGCNPDVLTDVNDLHHKLASTQTDLIILDWRLSDSLVGSQAIERAARLIDTFSDLKFKFSNHRPKVVTYSVLPAQEISFPNTQYFEHLGHWQKPIRPEELASLTTELIKAVEA